MNASREKSWMGSPSKLQIGLFSTIVIVGFVLLLSAMTNFFTTEMSNRQSLILGAMTVPSMGLIFALLISYFKAR
jgi:uncharacterized membrane-anchored protein